MSQVSVFDVTLTCVTTAYTDGDLLFDSTEVPHFFRDYTHYAYITGVQLLDVDDQGLALDLLLFDTEVDAGTVDDASNITDASALSQLGWIDINASDYVDWGGHRTATIKHTDTGMYVPGWIKSASGGTSLYIAGITRGAPTYGGGSLKLKISVMYD